MLRRLLRRHARTERCEVCGAHLKPRETVTLEEWFDCGESDGGSRYGSITATYCKRDAPKGAKP